MKRVLAAFLAIIMLLSLCACGKKAEKFKWEDIRLHDILPKPPANKGEIHRNTESELWMEVIKVPEALYNDYVDSCKENGFNIDSEDTDISYEAFNSDGYKLRLMYYERNKELTINLESPMELKEIYWPKSDIANLLPIPKSTIGNIQWESDSGFLIYLGNTSIEEFNQYSDACAEKGFNVDYSRGDKYYYADNSDGYYISLNYEGYNIMKINIDAPDDIDEPPETNVPEDNPEPPVDEPDDVSSEATGIRPEFKEAMDSYEAFFDEYISFMSRFTEAEFSLDLLTDYTDFMEKYTETMESMDKWGEGDLSTEESAYYLEVTTRINNKLINSIAG